MFCHIFCQNLALCSLPSTQQPRPTPQKCFSLKGPLGGRTNAVLETRQGQHYFTLASLTSPAPRGTFTQRCTTDGNPSQATPDRLSCFYENPTHYSLRVFLRAGTLLPSAPQHSKKPTVLRSTPKKPTVLCSTPRNLQCSAALQPPSNPRAQSAHPNTTGTPQCHFITS